MKRILSVLAGLALAVGFTFQPADHPPYESAPFHWHLSQLDGVHLHHPGGVIVPGRIAQATSPVPWLNASSGAGGVGSDALIWELDATRADDITAANTKGPAVTVTRAGSGKTRITSTGTFENLSANVLLRDYVGNGTNFMVAGFNVEEARTNLVLQSEDLNTTWVNVGTPTFSGGTTTLGSANLDTLGDDAAGTLEGKTQTVTFTANAVKACSVVIKQGTSTSSVVHLRDTTAAANRILAVITWSGGLPVVTMTTGTFEGVDKLASSSFRVRLQSTTVTAANVNQYGLYPATDAAFASAGTGTAELGAMQCENADFSSSYIPTTTATVARAVDLVTVATSSITGFNPSTLSLFAASYGAHGQCACGSWQVPISLHDGTGDEVIWLARTNTNVVNGAVRDGAVTQASIGAAPWVADQFGKIAMSVAANDIALSFDGTAVVTDVTATLPTVTTLRVGGTSSLPTQHGPIKKVGLYNRAFADSELIEITEPDPIWAWDAGSLAMAPYIGVGTPTVTRAGNTATRVNASGLIEVVNANLPRFDYSPTSVGQLLGLLIEETRTNLLLRSAELENASWSKSATVSANSDTAPDGTVAADTLTDSSAAAAQNANQSIVVANDSVTRCGSVFIKKTSGQAHFFGLRMQYVGGTALDYRSVVNTNTGAISATLGSPASATVADWRTHWRAILCVTNNSLGNTTLSMELFPAFNTNGAAGSDAVTQGSNIFWGMQFEQGDFATSHVPTAGATAARNADAINLPTSMVYGFSGATLTMFAEAIAPANDAANFARPLSINDGTSAEEYAMSRSSAVARAFIFDGGANQFVATGAGSWTQSTVGKISLAVAANDASLVLNGGAPVTDAAVTLPTVTSLSFGSTAGVGAFWNGPVRNLRVYNVRKAGTVQQAITAP